MASDWKILPLEVPTDAQVVWIRINYWFGQPVLAAWDETNQQFTIKVNDIVYPAWVVGRWKPQT